MYPRLAHFGSITIPTYSVVAAVGLIAALLLAEWCAPHVGLARERIWHFCLGTLAGTLVLSRIALAAQNWAAFRTYPRVILTLPTLTRSGPLLVVLCAAACIVAMHLPWLRTLDAVTPAALLLLTALHVGSFFAGDDLGSRTDLALGNLVRGDEGHHPVALYAAVLTALACAASMVTLLRNNRVGRTFGVGLAAVSVARFVADEFRPGYLLPQLGIPGFLRADQLLLLALFVAGMLFLLDWSPRHAK
ncbi:prolipoprotein diacylglyceryl transferase [Terriglobus aquaticus]|uniref:Prolipoprotein diacylglyceryl transferase n=1 Tax=Terriglobus aquaticus TaxID=940139 RepID=A0ABW9KQT7_9BACT|nr:prolipoprotein diacylglyceryl transferase [Terriglobus aquaticus]